MQTQTYGYEITRRLNIYKIKEHFLTKEKKKYFRRCSHTINVFMCVYTWVHKFYHEENSMSNSRKLKFDSSFVK